MSAAVGETLQRLLVHLTAISPFPTLLTNAGALRAETVTRASWVRAVHLLAILPFVPSHAIALAVGAVTVPVAVRYLALVVSQGALLSFPPGIALALAVYVFPCNPSEADPLKYLILDTVIIDTAGSRLIGLAPESVGATFRWITFLFLIEYC